jgi:hypothetical protein
MVFFSQEKKAVDEELARLLMSIANQMGQFIAREFAEEAHEKIGKELALILDSTSEGIYGVNLAGAITTTCALMALPIPPLNVLSLAC